MCNLDSRWRGVSEEAIVKEILTIDEMHPDKFRRSL